MTRPERENSTNDDEAAATRGEIRLSHGISEGRFDPGPTTELTINSLGASAEHFVALMVPEIAALQSLSVSLESAHAPASHEAAASVRRALGAILKCLPYLAVLARYGTSWKFPFRTPPLPNLPDPTGHWDYYGKDVIPGQPPSTVTPVVNPELTSTRARLSAIVDSRYHRSIWEDGTPRIAWAIQGLEMADFTTEDARVRKVISMLSDTINQAPRHVLEAFHQIQLAAKELETFSPVPFAPAASAVRPRVEVHGDDVTETVEGDGW